MRSLTVWLNGERRGVMVPSGLAGPLRWAVDLYEASVRIDGPKPPPKPPLAFTHYGSEVELSDDGTLFPLWFGPLFPFCFARYCLLNREPVPKIGNGHLSIRFPGITNPSADSFCLCCESPF